jgi:hypothetical protein
MASAAFDDIKLLEIRTRMENMWGDAQVRKNYTAKVDSLNAILGKQTASNAALSASDKDYDVAVDWINLADATVSSFDPAVGPAVCGIDGPELQAGRQTYKLTIGSEKSFKVEETGSMDGGGLRGIDATFAEIVSRGLLQTRKALVEDANKRVLAKLDTFSGTNKYLGGFAADGISGDTVIPSADFGARKVLPYLSRVQLMNKYVDPYVLDGGLLWDDLYLAQAGSTGSDAIALRTLTGQFDIREDMWNFANAGVDNKLYLVDSNAVAFFSKNHFSAQPRELGINGLVNYSMPLPELNGVSADVVYQFKCENNKYYHVWKLMLRYDLLLNPVIGDADLTGVLAFQKGA